MKIWGISIALCFVSVIGFSQLCGFNPTQADIERLLKNKETYYETSGIQTRETIYIPIKFHLVADNLGVGRITEDKVVEQLCALNKAYEPVGFQFYFEGNSFNYINNTALFEAPAGQTGSTQIIAQKASKGQKAMNIFITKTADTGGLGTTLGYYSPALDVIVIKKDQINGVSGTVPHEVGHFFSLMHTFNGWDGEAYEEAVHGNPISSQFSPTGVLNELQDGSNCENAGDFLCDTNVDFNFGYGWSGCSEFTKNIKDFKGDVIDVEERNFMGYFIGCSEYHFSDLQIEMMNMDYQSTGRNYIKNTFIPTTLPIGGQVELQYPINEVELDYYDNVILEWKSIENAEKYFVRLKSGIDVESYVTVESTLTLPELKKNITYRWQVLPFNRYNGCAIPSVEETFKTGTNNNTGLDVIPNANIEVYPTIVADGHVIIKSSKTLDVQMAIHSIDGKTTVLNQNNLQNGSNQLALPTSLVPGLYFLEVRNQDHAQKFKLIIQ